jgi:hypothetical protein
LDEIHRLAEPDYLPTTGALSNPVIPLYLISMLDDILHVRLQTLGVTEHSFDITVAGTRYTWILYDVGGAVSRYYHCLLPFFVDVSYWIPVERPGERPDLAMINAKMSHTLSPQRHAWVPYFEDGKH